MSFVNNDVCQKDTTFWLKYYSINLKDNAEVFKIEKKIIELSVCYAHIMLAKYSHLLNQMQKNNTKYILDQFGAKLEFSELTYIPRYAEFRQKSRAIVLYTENINKNAQLFSLSPEDFMHVCLVHEIFHLLEDVEGDTIKVIAEKIGTNSKKNSKLFSQSSEIAAHTFAKNICALGSIII